VRLERHNSSTTLLIYVFSCLIDSLSRQHNKRLCQNFQSGWCFTLEKRWAPALYPNGGVSAPITHHGSASGPPWSSVHRRLASCFLSLPPWDDNHS